MGFIELKDIEVSLGEFKLKVDCLGLEKGSMVAVLGNNGSGKSTFLSFLLGLRPYKGTYLIGGKDFRALSVREANQTLALLPQTVSLQMPLDVFYVVLTGRFPWTDGRAYTDEDISLTEMALRDFDIYHLRDRPFSELSGGERQRVLLARTFNRTSEVVLLDGPFTALDLRHQWETLGLLKDRARDRLILVVLHDIEMAVREFDRFLFFKDGQLLHDLEKDTLTEDVLSEVFEVKIRIMDHERGRFVFVQR
jgi:iron complex transport system ATP-binding protein